MARLSLSECTNRTLESNTSTFFCFIQAQAIVVGFLASIAAMVFGWIPEGKFNISHGFLLCASSVMTASFASLVLGNLKRSNDSCYCIDTSLHYRSCVAGTIMIAVIVLSRKCKINPDNVATPIAASLGDLTTLALLSFISNVMYKTLGQSTMCTPAFMYTHVFFQWRSQLTFRRYLHAYLRLLFRLSSIIVVLCLFLFSYTSM